MPSEVRKLRGLEEENARLRRLVAVLSLDEESDATRGHPTKTLRPAQRREAVEFYSVFQVIFRRATQTIAIPRATRYSHFRNAELALLRHWIKETAAVRVCYSYPRIQTLLTLL